MEAHPGYSGAAIQESSLTQGAPFNPTWCFLIAPHRSGLATLEILKFFQITIHSRWWARLGHPVPRQHSPASG